MMLSNGTARLFFLGYCAGIENHALSVALHYMHYNFCRLHKTLRVTPAMAAGVTDRLWSVSDIVTILEAWESSGNTETARYPR
jgi:hypothetical protein